MKENQNNFGAPSSGHWPSELFDKTFENLQETAGATSLVDIIQTIGALNGTVHSDAILSFKNKILLVDLVGTRSSEELSRDSRCAKALLSDSNFVLSNENFRLSEILKKAAGKRIVLITDRDVRVSTLKTYLGNFKECTDVILCCDSLYDSPIGSTVSMLADEAKEAGTNPKHLIVDFAKDFLVSTGYKLLGFLDCKFLRSLSKFPGTLFISIPNVTELEMHYRTLDNFTDSFFEKKIFSYRGTSHCTCSIFHDEFDLFLKKVLLNFLHLSRIDFVDPCMSEKCCNSIDLSYDRLRTLEDCKANLKDVFEIYAMIQWNLPQVKDFPGHSFNFCTSDDGGTAKITDALKLFAKITACQQSHSPTSYPIDLFPKNTKKSRVVNWISTESLSTCHIPLIQLNSKSLEMLELKPLVLDGSSRFMVQGLYLPNLKLLSLADERAIRGEFLRQKTCCVFGTANSKMNNADPQAYQMSPDCSKCDQCSKLGYDLICPLFFSKRNGLSSCERLTTPVFENRRAKYLLNKENLQDIMPRINLKEIIIKPPGKELELVIL